MPGKRSRGKSTPKIKRTADSKPCRKASPRKARPRKGNPECFALPDDPYRAFFEKHPRPMWIIDPQTHCFLEVNQAAVAHYGYSREEFLSMTLRDIRPPDEVARFLEKFSRPTPEVSVVPGVWRHVKKDGTEIHVEITASPLPFRGRHARVVVIFDVTDRERALADLAGSEARKASMLEVVQDAIIAADVEGRVTEFNPAAERMFGYSRDEIMGRDVVDTMIPHDMRSRHRQVLVNYAETGEHRMIGRGVEETGLRADGTEFPIEITLSAMQVNGQPAFTACIRDLTERKLTEAQIAAGFGVARALAEATTDEEVTHESLRAFCEPMGWDVGALWVVDENSQILRLADMWHAPGVDVAAFEEESRRACSLAG